MKCGENILPIAYGNEEELSLMVVNAASLPPETGTQKIISYKLPEDISESDTFLTNGGRLYWDGGHLESATPECADINELVLRIHASEKLLTEIISGQYIKYIDNNASRVRLNRRVVDLNDHSWGMHDNFGFEIENFTDIELPVVVGHLATRSFVTGAGLVGPEEYYFAQKASVSHHGIKGYGYTPYMFRLASNSLGIADRVEIRCGDINVSDWAVRMRLGSTALALAIQQTEFANNAPSIGNSPLKMLNRFNQLNLQEDGSIRPTRGLSTAVSYQKWLAETALSLPDKGYNIPPELLAVAKDLAKYCEDFKGITKQEAPIHSLASRADWAAKLAIILRGRQRDMEQGIERHRNDPKEMAQDLLYDQIDIHTTKESRDIQYGWGYILQRDLHGHKPDPEALRDAMVNPPNTRAKLRANLIRKGHTIIEWDLTRTNDREYFLPHPLTSDIVGREAA